MTIKDNNENPLYFPKQNYKMDKVKSDDDRYRKARSSPLSGETPSVDSSLSRNNQNIEVFRQTQNSPATAPPAPRVTEQEVDPPSYDSLYE